MGEIFYEHVKFIRKHEDLISIYGNWGKFTWGKLRPYGHECNIQLMTTEAV